METNVNYTIVGTFVIVLFAFIVMSVIWLSAGVTATDYTTYQVLMKESVSGLSVDAPVEFNGVNVGSIKNIEISQKDPQVVIILLNVKNNTPITVGTRATLNMKGLTGMAYLALIDKGLDKRLLKKLPRQPYPIINTAPSLLVRFDTGLTQLNDSLHQVSVSIRSLMDQENLISIKKILNNVESVTQSLIPLIQSSHNLLPTVNQTVINLENITRDLVSVSAEIKQNPSVLIRGQQRQALGPGEK
jgi:phospholipid/cholesterol/gamma-HCH transport system substrate-binding protein